MARDWVAWPQVGRGACQHEASPQEWLWRKVWEAILQLWVEPWDYVERGLTSNEHAILWEPSPTFPVLRAPKSLTWSLSLLGRGPH